MRRYLLPCLLAAALFGCGGKKAASPEATTSEATTSETTTSETATSAAPAAPPVDPYPEVTARRTTFVQAKQKNPNPESTMGLLKQAEQILVLARNKGDAESVKFFEKEVEELRKRYRDFCEGIYAKAEKEAELMPDWSDRYTRWEKCVSELKNKCPENAAMVAAADDRMNRAMLMESANVRFSTLADEAKTAAVENNDPETAVAKLAIFRAWMRGSGLIRPPKEGEVEAGIQQSDDGAGDLLKKAEALITEYEAKCTVDKAAAEADTADRELEFVADFQWTGEGGSANTEGTTTKVETGDNGGSIECLHEEWHEFTLMLEVRLEEGSNLWFGTRAQVVGDRKEYKKKCKVEFADKEWHRLQVLVTATRLKVAELKGEGDKDIAFIGEIEDLPPVGSSVKGGIMIGLAAGTTLELRNLKARVNKGGPGFVKEDGSGKTEAAPKKPAPEEEEEEEGMNPDPGGDEPKGGDEPQGGEDEGKKEEGKTDEGGTDEGKTDEGGTDEGTTDAGGEESGG